MANPLQALRGFKGHPLHPPLTDLAIGGYTVGTLALVGAAAPWFSQSVDRKLTGAAFVSIVAGLVMAGLSVVTGLLDYFQIPRRTGMRRVANLHWMSVVPGNAAFVLVARMIQDSSRAVETNTLMLSVLAFALISAGGYLGGTIVFEYGMRVQNNPPETPTSVTLKPKWPPD